MSSVVSAHITRKKLSFIHFILPICPVIFIGGTPFSVLNILINDKTRWFVLGILFFYFSVKKNTFRYIDKKLAFILFLYLGWCFMSAFWSSAFSLSFIKSLILTILVFTMFSVGIEWVRTNSIMRCFDYLWFLAFYSLAMGFLGKYNSHSTYRIGEIQVYTGLFTNQSNMFGSMLFMASPYLFWKTYSHWLHRKKRFIWGFLLVSCFFYLFLTVSRSAILGASVMSLFFFLSFNMTKKILILVCILMTCIITIFSSDTSIIDNAMNRYIYKNTLPH